MLCKFFLHSRLKLQDQDSEAHVRAIVAITTLLKNAPELGSSQIGKDGITQIMLTMAQSDDKVQQIVAAEAIIAACAKKKDTISIISHVRIFYLLIIYNNGKIEWRARTGPQNRDIFLPKLNLVSCAVKEHSF